MLAATLRGVIERRILVNYRVEPATIARLLPPGFRPLVHAGSAWVGLCLIRLRGVRPSGWPARFGLASENAAHRVAVEWESPQGPRAGVFIWRRDTNSLLNAWAGGRLFPGVHQSANFRVRETDDRFEIGVLDGWSQRLLSLDAARATSLPSTAAFASLDEASRFFQAGACGYSCDPRGERLEALELRCRDWRLMPLAVHSASSAFFDDRARFPQGAIEFDSALLMEDVEHEWVARPATSVSEMQADTRQ